MKDTGTWCDLDSLKYTPIQQGLIIINSDEDRLNYAEKFYTFLLSDRVKHILSDFGYKTEIDE
jgi:ABC-type molybdate transport system substrate-binding protein